ncbi:hypothetical protein N7537_011473 [Penicillium hordei]|uniref:Mid2 domain-containing protein n=1 Tax=Penicillium hordei TaxID=40994 RepID=A0AAD6GU23_9EURO|nr:uncharacterized protein N7537_011473 [Penicillium hordei]KAJ5588795.1 hypothetical protein N7537_011473 [Penicillium hordei]
MSTLVLLYFLHLSIAAAGNGFTYPPTSGDTGEYVSNLAFTVGQKISLKWTLESDNPVDFWLLQDTSGDGNGCPLSYSRLCHRITQNAPNNGSFPWVVNRMDMTTSDIYYIAAFYSTTQGFNTHYFNITDPSSRNTISTTSSPSSATSSSSASDANTVATAPSHSGSSSSTAVGAIAGGVVGGVVGISIIVVLAFMLYKAKRKTRSPGFPQNGLVEEPAPQDQSSEDSGMPGFYVLKPEMDGTSRSYELPS